MEPWAWAIIAPVVLALIGALWKLFGRSTEKGEEQSAKDIARVEKRLDDHIAEDSRIHERVVRLEAHREVDAREIIDLRTKTTGMKHDILGEVTKTIMGWYNDIIDRLLQRK